MSFLKYNSIENHYNAKYLNRIPTQWHNEPYLVSEKLDGANISLYFNPKQPLQVGKRSGFISKDENFFNIWKTLDYYSSFIKTFQNAVDKTNHSLRMFGEIYGAGINGRINYGQSQYIKIFDVMEQDKFILGENLLAMSKIYPFFFTEFTVYNNLAEALSVDVELPVIDANTGLERISEGVVIKPMTNRFLYETERFIVKKKSKAFADKEQGAHNNNEKREAFTPEVLVASDKLKSYFTMNRLIDLYSKEGKIQETKEIGKYITLMIEDAKEDFFKENQDITKALNDDAMKTIFKPVGAIAAKLIKESMAT